jgi:hypothetical protein
MTTTAITRSFKLELFCAAHCFLPTYTPAVSAGVSGQFTLTSLTNIGAGTYTVPTFAIVPGMLVTGTGIGAGAHVGQLLTQSSVSVDTANSGTVTSGTVAFAGDIFKILLVKVTGLSGTYDNTLQNAGTPGTGTPSATNVGTDEQTASGSYAAGGSALANNMMPAIFTNTACASWSANPQWTSFTTIAGGVGNAVIYNNTPRMGSPANGITANLSGSAINRIVSNHDFGGAVTVTAGTLTLTIPSPGTSGILTIA